MFAFLSLALLVGCSVAVLVAAVGAVLKPKARPTAVIFGGAAFGVGLLAYIGASLTTVEAGHVGIPVLFGSIQKYVLQPGINLVNPLMRVEEMSVRTENYIMSSKHDEGERGGDDSIVALTSTRLPVPMDISVPYRLVDEAAPWVYEKFGSDGQYREKILRNAVRAAVRRATAKFTDDEVFATKRDQLAQEIKTVLEEEIGLILGTYQNHPEKVFVVSQILIGDMQLPKTIKEAIEAKLAADQSQQKMEFKIKEAEKEATRKEKEANGIKRFQDIVSQGINENTLRWKALEATEKLAESPNSKIVIIGSGKDGLPVILGNDTQQAKIAEKE